MRIAFTLTWKKLLALAMAGVLAALLVGWSGLVSISASSGHYSPVAWFLHWTMRNAVETQAMAVAVPEDIDLGDLALVQRAAGHFASDCAFCHGAPGIAQSAATEAMMPPPPRLEQRVGRWRDRELFWIGQHGIKYSGMPAWLSQERPDEVWAMVAFLRALPTLSPADYAGLALGGAAAPDLPPVGNASRIAGRADETALADCARCHGRDGRGTAATLAAGPTAGAFPVIAGQPEAYLYETLRAFARGARHSGYMQSAAGRYDEKTLAGLAAHYAAQPAAGPTVAPSSPPAGLPEAAPSGSKLAETRGAMARAVPAAAAYGPPYDAAGLLALGRRMATEGVPERKLPSCNSCHGGGTEAARYPYLGGQPAWYIATQLELWRDGKRAGTRNAHLMDKIAIHLTDEQIAAAAAWYSAAPVGR